MGVECLQGILEDIPPIHSVPPPIRRRGDVVAGGGFVAILLLSALPWSRGASSGLFGAWSPSWSVVAVAGSLGGVAVAVVALRRRWRPGLAALLYAALGLVVVVGAILHRVDPPLLSEPSAVPWFAAIGGLVTVVGALIKGQDVLRARRPGALTHRLLHRAPEMLLP